MPDIVNQNVTDSRRAFTDRLSARFPDRKYIGQDGQNGQDAQEGLDDMYQSALEMFDEYDARDRENEEHNRRLLDLLDQDETAAEFINLWATTGDPVKALVSVFGSEKVKAALESEEGLKSLEDGEREYLQRESENRKAAEDRDEKFQKSLQDLNAFGDAKNINDEGKLEIIQFLIKFANSALDGVFTEKDFQMAYNALHHDTDVQTARNEGTLAGRNEKIREVRRDKATRSNLPTFSSQSAPMTPPKGRVTEGDRWEL